LVLNQTIVYKSFSPCCNQICQIYLAGGSEILPDSSSIFPRGNLMEVKPSFT